MNMFTITKVDFLSGGLKIVHDETMPTVTIPLPFEFKRHVVRDTLTNQEDYDWELPPPLPPIAEGFLVDVLTRDKLAVQPFKQCDNAYPDAHSAYEAWCLELDVSSTTSFTELENGAYDSNIVNVGFMPLMNGSSNLVGISPKGGFALYKSRTVLDPNGYNSATIIVEDNDSNQTEASISIMTQNAPSLIITVCPESTGFQSSGAKWQKATDCAVFYAKFGSQYDVNEYVVHAAMRIKPNGYIEVVASGVQADPNARTPRLQFFTSNETDYPRNGPIIGYAGYGGVSTDIPVNTTLTYATEVIEACNVPDMGV